MGAQVRARTRSFECQTLMGAQSICLQSFKDNLSVHAERSFTPRQESNCENCIAWPCLYVCLTERRAVGGSKNQGGGQEKNLIAKIVSLGLVSMYVWQNVRAVGTYEDT